MSQQANRRLAIVTVISNGKYLERDRDSISLMNCFAVRHGVPYFVEPHFYGDTWYNKQHALHKYLPHFEWILYVDPDTYFVDRDGGYRALLALTDRLDAGGYHIAMAELHHSGVGGFDAGVVLMKRSATGWRFLREWLDGTSRQWRNADNGFLNVLFLRWVLPKYGGECDQFLYKHEVAAANGSMALARESSKPAIQAYGNFFPCFYKALGLPTRPYSELRLRAGSAPADDAGGSRAQWHPFYVMHWDEPGVLSCAYPRRMKKEMTSKEVHCNEPLVYHAKDVVARFWSSPHGPNVTNGRCI